MKSAGGVEKRITEGEVEKNEEFRNKDRTEIGKSKKKCYVSYTSLPHVLILLIVTCTSFGSLLSKRVNQQPIVNVNRGRKING